MSTFTQIFDIQEQICYVQCSYCATFLLVSVPITSLTMVVTVKCGHCTSFLSVNMKKASFLPSHLYASSLHKDDDVQKKSECCPEEVCAPKALETNRSSSSSSSSNDESESDSVPVNHVINKPPEKRQRAPSAYNCFIKEEIKRLKSENPCITHKQAFSTSAKNWARIPMGKRNGDKAVCRGKKNDLSLEDVIS